MMQMLKSKKAKLKKAYFNESYQPNTKQECIAAINLKYKAGLSSINKSYSNINKSKNVWWFSIATSKLQGPVNLLLKI